MNQLNQLKIDAMLSGQRDATAQVVLVLSERCGLLTAELAAAQARIKELESQPEAIPGDKIVDTDHA